MRILSYFFFYTYTGLVLIAGFWGAFIYPKVDFQFLLRLDIDTLSEDTRNTLLSQYRFLRAIEFGFGLWALYFTKRIFTENVFNRLFLYIMLGGIVARIIGIVVEGVPSYAMLAFMIYELIAIIFIFIYTKMRIDAT